jgi:hypothetical protein
MSSLTFARVRSISLRLPSSPWVIYRGSAVPSLIVGECCHRVSIRSFSVGHSSFSHIHFVCLPDCPDICSTSLELSFSVCCLWRVHKRHCRTCTCALGPLLQVHTTILSSHTSACARGTMLAGQAEHLSTVYSEVLAVGYVRFSPTTLTPPLPSHCLPPSDVGFENSPWRLRHCVPRELFCSDCRCQFGICGIGSVHHGHCVRLSMSLHTVHRPC